MVDLELGKFCIAKSFGNVDVRWNIVRSAEKINSFHRQSESPYFIIFPLRLDCRENSWIFTSNFTITIENHFIVSNGKITNYAFIQNQIGLLARRKEELTRIASQIQASTEIMHLDLESVDAAKEYRIFLERFSTIDTVIYCAGFGEINPELDWKFCQKTLTVNVMAFT